MIRTSCTAVLLSSSVVCLDRFFPREKLVHLPNFITDKPSEALFGDSFFWNSWLFIDDARILESCSSGGSITRIDLLVVFVFVSSLM